MNSPYPLSTVLAAITCSFLGPLAHAEPIPFSEVSLLLRARESEPSIVQEVSQRKLVRALTPQQETVLQTQGARESLLQTLRRPENVLAPAEASAFEARREQMRGRNAAASPSDSKSDFRNNAASDKVHVFNVAFGHPINLSRWGGLDYEIAFYTYRNAGEDVVQPVLIDNVRTVTEVTRPIRFTSEDEAFTQDWFAGNEVRNRRYTPYGARGDFRDSRLNLNDTVSVRSNFASRPLTIDWQNPTVIAGQPYTFYPVYGAGEVSLYYIAKANDRTARVAVVLH